MSFYLGTLPSDYQPRQSLTTVLLQPVSTSDLLTTGTMPITTSETKSVADFLQ